MSYVPELENDLFISYTHIDDQPLTEGQKGWISNFHNSLQVRLRQLLGDDLTIWRDAKLQGNDEFSPVIFKQFPRTGILVSILSPRYLNSSWCLDELRAFSKAAEQIGGTRINDKARVFKVVKTFVPREKHPPELQGLLGYEFYSVDPATGRPREFLMDPGTEGLRNYWAKLEDLAYDIHELLKTLRNGVGASARPPGPTVYIAETSSDVQIERDKILRELRQRGNAVVPDKPLPLQTPGLENEVRAYLENCQLSIHLVGENYGVIPEGETRSIVDVQNELASRIRRLGFSRIIWLPPGPEPQDTRQKMFRSRLRSELGDEGRVELLETPLEDLKTLIQDRLRAPEKKPAPARSEGPEHVYLICDQHDLEAAQAISDQLFDRGYEVILPAFDGSDAEIREYHVESLKLCDAAAIYWGATGEIWVRTKLRDLDKAGGYGRSREMLAKAVYLGEPRSVQKDRFRSHEAIVLRGSLDPFIKSIEDGKAGEF